MVRRDWYTVPLILFLNHRAYQQFIYCSYFKSLIFPMSLLKLWTFEPRSKYREEKAHGSSVRNVLGSVLDAAFSLDKVPAASVLHAVSFPLTWAILWYRALLTLLWCKKHFNIRNRANSRFKTMLQKELETVMNKLASSIDELGNSKDHLSHWSTKLFKHCTNQSSIIFIYTCSRNKSTLLLGLLKNPVPPLCT